MTTTVRPESQSPTALKPTSYEALMSVNQTCCLLHLDGVRLAEVELRDREDPDADLHERDEQRAAATPNLDFPLSVSSG